jgi:hypothetical protein
VINWYSCHFACCCTKLPAVLHCICLSRKVSDCCTKLYLCVSSFCLADWLL